MREPEFLLVLSTTAAAIWEGLQEQSSRMGMCWGAWDLRVL